MCQEHKLIEIIIKQTDPAFVNTLKRQLNLPFKEKMKHGKDCLMMKPILKVGDGNKENPNSPNVRLIKNLNPKGGNYFKRVNGLIMLKVRGLI